MNCEHEEYEMVGSFPSNMEIEDEYMFNFIKCMECGKVGKEYYGFVERKWSNED